MGWVTDKEFLFLECDFVETTKYIRGDNKNQPSLFYRQLKMNYGDELQELTDKETSLTLGQYHGLAKAVHWKSILAAQEITSLP